MPTIVEYTDVNPPKNQYPKRIISPPHSGPCCATNMEAVGKPQVDGHWLYQYKRCRQCGFAVRGIVRVLPDGETVATLREKFKEISFKGLE